jgi:putative protein-disulfide isomerase
MEKPVIYYIYDPLCGWCFGFSRVIKKLHQQFASEIEFRVMSGGMVTGEREGPIGEVAAYIADAYKQVEETTGVKFGQAFLEGTLKEGKAQFTSLPGALAMAAFRTYQPDNAVAFAARIQEAIYVEGLAPAKAQTYGHCAEDFGMNATDFMKLMVDKRYLNIVQEEFKVVQKWGVKGFPSVVYQKEDKALLIARGYTAYENLEESLKQAQVRI